MSTHGMARPVIPPLTILPTAPETFSVLEQRMRIAEEQAESLMSDLQDLGITNHRFTKCAMSKSADHIRPISPVRARPAFTGDGETLWRNCESLVTRMCHMESMLHTLKLNIFRLHTDRELSTKQSDELEHRLVQMQGEHDQELKDAQLEVMRLRQKLNSAIEQQEREMEAKEKLSAALEIATTTKTDVAKELIATKACMSLKLAKLQLLEEEQAVLLLTVQDMKNIVEEEQNKVQELQQYCQKMNSESKEMKDKLNKAESELQEAKKENEQLHNNIEAKELVVRQLQEELKKMRQTCEEGQSEHAQMRADSVALREAAEKVQCLNQQLENQCSELTETVQKLTHQNLKLGTQHQKELKVAQEQEALLRAVQTSLGGELQKMSHERANLETELEFIRTEHSKCKEKAEKKEHKNTVQIEIQEKTIACLRADLNAAIQDKEALENGKISLQEELHKSRSDFLEKKQCLEVQLTASKLEQEMLQSSLWAKQQEIKHLEERVAMLEQEKHAQTQVESLLDELTYSKSKLAYEKGKLQSRVEQLQSDLQSFGDARSENSKLCKVNAALQARYTQTEHLLLCKDKELALAIKARDEAIKEKKKLRQQIDTLEEMERNAKAVLQQQLSMECGERTRISETLENVLSSHVKLQKDLEKMQTELGRKDNELLSLQKDRTQRLKCVEKLKAELQECNRKLHSSQCQLRGEIEPLQKLAEVAREDNQKLSHALDMALQRNSALQNQVNELEQHKELQEKQLCLNQTKAEEDYRLKEKLFEEQLASLKKQQQIEKREAKKAVRKEVTELKKALDSVTTKATELSRINRELENETLHQKDLIHSLQTQVQSFNENKRTAKQNERTQDLEAELIHMKKIKESYEKNNNEQYKRIQEFINEVDIMRKEINEATSQKGKESNLQKQLKEEVTSRKKLEQRCKELECTVQKLKQLKLDPEMRDVSEQSEQITVSLQEAHSWLRSNFDELQLQILRNRQEIMKEHTAESTRP
ncbi:coiled-coil domain-containing protein 150 isoform X3 [Engystomops pustulosus]|uniref:coiled-coil domain-containing protein 150 isoform X3 n=1 Tax=Engystomops pustulosus TaxID=76066 RepID=UPI003AFADAE3